MGSDGGAAADRQRRLSDRLRDNLKRRKEQSRARAAAAGVEQPEAQADVAPRKNDGPGEPR